MEKVQIAGMYTVHGEKMSIVKVIEVIGESEKDWNDAIQVALTEASKTVDDIVGIDIIGMSGTVKNNKVVEYKANAKIAFVVKR
jgi:hypothetical protein